MKNLFVHALFALALFTSCADSSADIKLTDDRTFDPETITVSAGETVIFTNESSASHSVTAYEDEIPDGADYFASGGFSTEQEARDSVAEALINAGATYEVRLDEPGTYEYFCIPHESQGMTGTIEVKATQGED